MLFDQVIGKTMKLCLINISSICNYAFSLDALITKSDKELRISLLTQLTLKCPNFLTRKHFCNNPLLGFTVCPIGRKRATAVSTWIV